MSSAALFSTVPKKDNFQLIEGGIPQIGKIREILDLDLDQVSKLTKIAKDKMRFDKRMSKALNQKLTEIATIIELVGNYFGGDLDKTTKWFRLPNPALGNISPRDMIRYGRYEKLQGFVVDALNDN